MSQALAGRTEDSHACINIRRSFRIQKIFRTARLSLLKNYEWRGVVAATALLLCAKR